VGWAKTAPKKSATKVSVQQKSSSKAKKNKKSKPKKGAWKRRGQQSIATERTLQIQEALASAGYLRTEPTGKMDAAT
jgi:peptidoglycan hydrolase-like protein with peptidoglycan-binding domain